MVRRLFLLAILAASAVYTWIAYADLSFLSSTGRLGPGFFPRILGTLAVAITLYTLFIDRRAPAHGSTIADEPDAEAGNHPRDTAIAVGLTLGMILLFNILGGITTVALFLATSLWLFNPRGHVTNLAVTVLVPLAIWAMFDVWLNASLPRSVFPFLV